MKQIMQEQYARTKQLLNENRATQKVLIDEELGLVSRLNAMEDLVRGESQRDKALQDEKNADDSTDTGKNVDETCP